YQRGSASSSLRAKSLFVSNDSGGGASKIVRSQAEPGGAWERGVHHLPNILWFLSPPESKKASRSRASSWVSVFIRPVGIGEMGEGWIDSMRWRLMVTWSSGASRFETIMM